MSDSLDRSYAYCRQVVRESSSNLAWCFWLLPHDQRRGMDALYALAREADDLVDREDPVEFRRSKLDEFRADLTAALAGDSKPPLFPAVADAALRFGISPVLLAHLLDGMAMDLDPQTPATFAELSAYCYRVASVVGLACLPIWGCTDDRATQPAIDCGIAFQLTNILRDLVEDAQRGRCYLPADELDRFGVNVGWDQLAPRAPAHAERGVDPGGPAPATGGLPPYTWSKPLAELIDFQIARARNYYESAGETARYLPPPGRRVFALMVARYRSILAAIEREPERILRKRVSLPWPKKVAVAVGAVWGSGFRVQGSGRREQRSEVGSQGSEVADNSAIRNPQSTIVHSALGTPHSPLPTVAILGGGLAGLAAAVALCQRGVQVELFEARHKLGGRAGSYIDRESEELVDHCQHVAMGCCTSFLDFCRQTRIDGLFTRHRRLTFFGPNGQRCDFQPTPFLPAPLHLAPALGKQVYLSAADRRSIACVMLRLARTSPADVAGSPTIGQWLHQQRQSPASIEHFWQVVLVSALGESLDRASLAAARKVFIDGFLGARTAYEVLTPNVTLGELYDKRVAAWLRKRGASIHLGSAAAQITRSIDAHSLSINLKDGSERTFDAVIAALPWRRLPEILSPPLAAALPDVVHAVQSIDPSPITSIHLWLDRPIMELPHAVLVGRLVQWVFAKCRVQSAECRVADQTSTLDSAPCTLHYYQVVISASRSLAGRQRDDVLREVLADLRAVFPQAKEASVVRWQMITDQEAVFSVRPGLSQIRPSQQTLVPGLFLAGDWTATNWPATMEGAVRSGYLAAKALLASLGRTQRIVPPDLPRGLLAQWLIRSP